jgi:hypothetical protein
MVLEGDGYGVVDARGGPNSARATASSVTSSRLEEGGVGVWDGGGGGGGGGDGNRSKADPPKPHHFQNHNISSVTIQPECAPYTSRG